MGRIKVKATKQKTSTLSRAVSAVSSLSSLKRGGGGSKRRRKGPSYWANKVIVEKLKKRYMKLKYGGAR